MLRLHRLTLTDFRNYAALTWQPRAPISVLVGPNGSGKTNLLEAISLLVPGRGMRGARGPDFPRRGGPGTWAVAARFSTVLGDADIGTGTLPDGSSDRRVFRLDGSTPRTITPLMPCADEAIPCPIMNGSEPATPGSEFARASMAG